MSFIFFFFTTLLAFLAVPSTALAQQPADKETPAPPEPTTPTTPPAPRKKAAAPKLPTPTHAHVSYGPHKKQFFHFWQADSKDGKPTPLFLFIHGGGWRGGSLEAGGIELSLQPMLDHGISVASVEYRFVQEAEDVEPPVKAPLHDAARALQTIRSKAAEWNLDKSRVAASGGSAGACSSLWLAFHDDLADPDSTDPIARESTRLTCAAVRGAQTTLDPKQMIEWTPNSKYGSHAFGIVPEKDSGPQTAFEAFLAQRDEILPWIAEYSPYALVTPDDPPVYLLYNAPPAIGQEQKDPTHTANFGLKLKERIDEVGGSAEFVYPGAPDVKHPDVNAFVIHHLKAGAATE